MERKFELDASNTNEQEIRLQRVRDFWENGIAKWDFEKQFEQCADGIVRIGMRVSSKDKIEGKEAYKKWVSEAINRESNYKNKTYDICHHPARPRVYLHCAEWLQNQKKPDEMIEIPVVIIFDFNPENLISVVDIYWKNQVDGYEPSMAKDEWIQT